jgi:hypothetical protein
MDSIVFIKCIFAELSRHQYTVRLDEALVKRMHEAKGEGDVCVCRGSYAALQADLHVLGGTYSSQQMHANRSSGRATLIAITAGQIVYPTFSVLIIQQTLCAIGSSRARRPIVVAERRVSSPPTLPSPHLRPGLGRSTCP